jgi:exodeoxyribonuclease V alpha subunit
VGDAFAAARRAALDGDRGTALDLAARARILCAHRRGPAGVAVWNRYVESWILGDAQPRRDYSGRAVLATRNDPRTGIVNGDAGMLVRVPQPDGTAGPLRAAFRRGDDIRDYAPAELDELDTAFAITIHKSQGSEYDTVVLIQPPSDSPLVTRELLYTAVTRTSRQLVVVGSEASIRRAVERPTSRVTGLEVALSEPDGG